jgi:hypothetical protein
MEENEREYFREMERKWRKSLPRYSKKELLDIFPKAREIIPQKIKEVEVLYQNKKNETKELLRRFEYHKDLYFIEAFIEVFLMDDLLKYKNRLINLKLFLKPESENSFGVNQEEIEIAQNYPIEKIAEQHFDIKRVGNRYKALCPFHNEKTPSFHLFTDSNRYYCFGCGESGNVINLTMALFGINFVDAVKMLQN